MKGECEASLGHGHADECHDPPLPISRTFMLFMSSRVTFAPFSACTMLSNEICAVSRLRGISTSRPQETS